MPQVWSDLEAAIAEADSALSFLSVQRADRTNGKAGGLCLLSEVALTKLIMAGSLPHKSLPVSKVHSLTKGIICDTFYEAHPIP